MSLLERELVPPAQSRASTSATERPRVAASRAAPAPTTPPPTTTTSKVLAAIAASAASRSTGPSRPAPSSSVVTPAVSRSLPVSRAPAFLREHGGRPLAARRERDPRLRTAGGGRLPIAATPHGGG